MIREVRLVPILSPHELRRDFADTIANGVSAGDATPLREVLWSDGAPLDWLWLAGAPSSASWRRMKLLRAADGVGVLGMVACSALHEVVRELPHRNRLGHALRQLERGFALRTRHALLFAWNDDEHPALGVAGSWAAHSSVLERASRLANEPIPVLVTGETGTGKDLVAHGLHRLGHRRRARFFALNASEVAEGLLESELFGHVRGAFTGALRDRSGFFEAAGDGTAFLDEIGELSPTAQAKLLRVIEEHRVRPVGGNDLRPLACRIVTATNRDLPAEAQAGRFRSDLFYRLRGGEIHLEPLRDRPNDLGPLCERFLGRIALRRDAPLTLAPSAEAALVARTWPGNVRELRQTLEAAAVASRDRIEAEHLGSAADSLPETKRAARTVAEVERAHIVRALISASGNKASAARMLGLTRQSLQRRIARHQIRLPPVEDSDPNQAPAPKALPLRPRFGR